jgi:hypothetical protein
MNLNAHFAWGLAMWGSADVARESGVFLPASIGYYYSGFHVCFALVNTNTAIPTQSLKRIGHAKLQEWIGEMPLGLIPVALAELRDLREAINYLGLGDGASKLRAVRGGKIVFQGAGREQDFHTALERARKLSLLLIVRALHHLEQWGPAHHVTVPKRDPQRSWLSEYMQEDFLLSILPDGDMRGQILKRVYYPMTPEAEADARVPPKP